MVGATPGNWGWKVSLAIFCTLLFGTVALAAPPSLQGLTINDVLDTVALDRVAASPDGEWVAAVVQRPAKAGEAFGRAAYEIDPSRTDVWLVSRRTGEQRNLTQGASSAAGFWCATWSPDGRKIAMLSTQPEGGEPRGGNNVRLYVWDRATGALARMADAAVMTQTRYGSPLYELDIRGGARGATVAHSCRSHDENAPFTWLDAHRLLVTMLPEGKVSGLLDEYGRPFDETVRTYRALRDGRTPTVSSVGSGAERLPPDESTYQAVLRTIDVNTGAMTTIGNVPTYPFQGGLAISVAPDGNRIAVLATIGVIPPARGERIPHHRDAWQVEKRLGFLDIAGDARVRWARLPADAQYPVELLAWSPDSRAVALRARAKFADTAASLFLASAQTLAVERIGVRLTVGTAEAGPYQRDIAAFWADKRRLLVQGRETPAGRDDWWLLQSGAAAVNLSRNMPQPPATFRRTNDGRLIAIAGERLIALDPAARRFVPLAAPPLPSGASIAWPQDPGLPTTALLIASEGKGSQVFQYRKLEGREVTSEFELPSGAELLDLHGGSALWRHPTRSGLFLRETAITTGARRDLLALNEHLGEVDWGRTMLIDYSAGDGVPLKAAVILPPGYEEGRRYPTITWVYGGEVVRSLDSYWLDPYLPGLYNLQLYAAQGYVVLIPSMPLKRDAPKNDIYPHLPNGVLPAVDRLIALGITDPARVGVMGQSFGGHSVYSLITQTNRFKAAVALAGLTDLTHLHAQFDPTARGYPGIEHEKSNNWSISEAGMGLGAPPYEDQDLYRRNSPLSYVDQVATPLLLIHGELDKRGAMAQAETFFYSLYRQGKTARLLRYWGESHSLAQSPANVRDIIGESLRWFDKYLRSPSSAEAIDTSKSAERN